MPEQPTPTPVAPEPQEEPKPDPLAASVAAAIGKLRRDAGLSERAAAKKLGTSQTQLRRMEDPRYLPSLRSLARVATAYGAHLVVSFETHDEKAKEERPAAKAAPPRETASPKAPPAKPARAKTAARASGSPSKGRRAAPGRARGAARRAPRRAAPRRKAR